MCSFVNIEGGMTKKIDLNDVLLQPMQINDANAKTVGDYLHKLLYAIWKEEEGFCGKRPFGNSGWEYEIYMTLIQGGFVRGIVDEDGYIKSVDEVSAKKIIFDCIEHVFKEYVGE